MSVLNTSHTRRVKANAVIPSESKAERAGGSLLWKRLFSGFAIKYIKSPMIKGIISLKTWGRNKKNKAIGIKNIIKSSATRLILIKTLLFIGLAPRKIKIEREPFLFLFYSKYLILNKKFNIQEKAS